MTQEQLDRKAQAQASAAELSSQLSASEQAQSQPKCETNDAAEVDHHGDEDDGFMDRSTLLKKMNEELEHGSDKSAARGLQIRRPG